ncbi:hypothetical protein TNCT_705731, partial [Trichonephila clavata]
SSCPKTVQQYYRSARLSRIPTTSQWPLTLPHYHDSDTSTRAHIISKSFREKPWRDCIQYAWRCGEKQGVIAVEDLGDIVFGELGDYSNNPLGLTYEAVN